MRTLPFAVAMMIVAPLSSKLVEWFGTKRVVVTGMLLFATGLVVASTSTVGSGYPRVAIAMVLHGQRHGPGGRAGDRVDHGLAAAATRPASARR